MKLREIVRRLKEARDIFEKVRASDNEIYLTVTRDKFRRAIEFVHELGFKNILSINVVDLLKTRRFVLIYTFTDFADPELSKITLHVKVSIPRDNPEIDSIADLYSFADYLERECYEMFGVKFIGNPNCSGTFFLDRSLENVFPQRKDRM